MNTEKMTRQRPRPEWRDIAKKKDKAWRKGQRRKCKQYAEYRRDK